MSLQDLTSDFVARINNAKQANKKTVKVLKNKLVLNCTKKLTSLGYFTSFVDNDREIEITLSDKLSKVKRISKPGQRIYIKNNEFPKIVGGIGYNIITSSYGVLSNNEAKEKKVGGELVLQVY
jgi:small subunit ribosomal protein S8